MNAAVTAWVLLAPALLIVYLGRWTFAWRAVLTTAAASVWWVVPLAVLAALQERPGHGGVELYLRAVRNGAPLTNVPGRRPL